MSTNMEKKGHKNTISRKLHEEAVFFQFIKSNKIAFAKHMNRYFTHINTKSI